jgi:protein-L-isoaspartate(D-aspartate) O-methyltransferase
MERVDMGQDVFAEMRRAMVDGQLRTSDVNDPAVLRAFESVARERFVPEARRSLAYMDRRIALGPNDFLNPPVTTGRMLAAAQLTGDEHVLLIRAGTGYVAALAARLAGRVTALERDADLLDRARALLGDLNNIALQQGDLTCGWAAAAPYDVILIDGAVEIIPDALSAQLADGGRMVMAFIDDGVTRLSMAHKAGNVLGLRHFADCDCAALAEFARSRAFTF